MTLDGKIAQVTQVDRGLIEKESSIGDYALCSIVIGCGSWGETLGETLSLEPRLLIPWL
jgi:hypothetical protein